jgi:hypothetical protein
MPHLETFSSSFLTPSLLPTPAGSTLSPDAAHSGGSNNGASQMQSFQAESMAVSLQAGQSRDDTSQGSLLRRPGAIVNGIVKSFATLLDRNARVERAIAENYACHAWCDSTERQLNDDIANSRM